MKLMMCICAEQESRTLRINDIHELVHQLPESNFEMLDVLVAHLCKCVHILVLFAAYIDAKLHAGIRSCRIGFIHFRA